MFFTRSAVRLIHLWLVYCLCQLSVKISSHIAYDQMAMQNRINHLWNYLPISWVANQKKTLSDKTWSEIRFQRKKITTENNMRNPLSSVHQMYVDSSSIIYWHTESDSKCYKPHQTRILINKIIQSLKKRECNGSERSSEDVLIQEIRETTICADAVDTIMLIAKDKRKTFNRIRNEELRWPGFEWRSFTYNAFFYDSFTSQSENHHNNWNISLREIKMVTNNMLTIKTDIDTDILSTNIGSQQHWTNVRCAIFVTLICVIIWLTPSTWSIVFNF